MFKTAQGTIFWVVSAEVTPLLQTQVGFPCDKVVRLLVTEQALLPIDLSTAPRGVAHCPVEILLCRGRHFSLLQLVLSRSDRLPHNLIRRLRLILMCNSCLIDHVTTKSTDKNQDIIRTYVRVLSIH